MRVELAQRLRDLREDHSMTQGQVAKMLGMDRSTYTYYETCKTNPSVESLRKLAALYNVSIDYLVNGKKD